MHLIENSISLQNELYNLIGKGDDFTHTLSGGGCKDVDVIYSAIREQTMNDVKDISPDLTGGMNIIEMVDNILMGGGMDSDDDEAISNILEESPTLGNKDGDDVVISNILENETEIAGGSLETTEEADDTLVDEYSESDDYEMDDFPLNEAKYVKILDDMMKSSKRNVYIRGGGGDKNVTVINKYPYIISTPNDRKK